LIEAAVDALLLRPADTMATGEREAIVDRIIDATLQYAIPPHQVPDGDEDMPDQEEGRSLPAAASDVCVLHTRETCPLVALMSDLRTLRTSATLSDASSLEDDRDVVPDAEILRARVCDLYVAAYRVGDLNPHVLDVLSTATNWPRPFLEDPDKETVHSSIGRPIREWSYAVLQHGLGWLLCVVHCSALTIGARWTLTTP